MVGILIGLAPTLGQLRALPMHVVAVPGGVRADRRHAVDAPMRVDRRTWHRGTTAASDGSGATASPACRAWSCLGLRLLFSSREVRPPPAPSRKARRLCRSATGPSRLLALAARRPTDISVYCWPFRRQSGILLLWRIVQSRLTGRPPEYQYIAVAHATWEETTMPIRSTRSAALMGALALGAALTTTPVAGAGRTRLLDGILVGAVAAGDGEDRGGLQRPESRYSGRPYRLREHALRERR